MAALDRSDIDDLIAAALTAGARVTEFDHIAADPGSTWISLEIQFSGGELADVQFKKMAWRRAFSYHESTLHNPKTSVMEPVPLARVWTMLKHDGSDTSQSLEALLHSRQAVRDTQPMPPRLPKCTVYTPAA